MALPVTWAEAAEGEPLELARQRLREYRDAGGFRPEAGHAVLRGEMKVFSGANPFNLSTIKDYARRGWKDAQIALDEMAADHLGRDGKLPPQLADYMIDRMNFNLPAPRGPKKASRFGRDICFIAVISEISTRFDLRPTRTKLSRGTLNGRPSGCAIVYLAVKAELPEAVFNGTERGLEGIWERMAPWVFAREEKLLALVPKVY